MKKYNQFAINDIFAKFGTCCYDCHLLYAGSAWSDVIVPDHIWEEISPSYDKGSGLLCFNCICRRLDEIGLENVSFQITSGPFAFKVR